MAAFAIDNFNRASADALGNLSGGTYAWNESAGDWDIVGDTLAEAQTVNSSDIAVLNPAVNKQDVYVQVISIDRQESLNRIGGGVLARTDSTWANGYLLRVKGDPDDALQLYKRVASSATLLGSYAIPSYSETADYTIKIECDGIDPGTIKCYLDGTERINESGDNALDSGNVGMRSFWKVRHDDFEAGDLASSSSSSSSSS